ncbi:S-adenosyl-L-methionine-dependent methyltransferase [Fusarium tricinctum]|uniref:S-adenosyl-L-methionine-dependent methyltransferase n=2 Tax=Fusarium tricinctum species complex TaxID=679429 RepID=A0A8K0RSM4_9HYPO|nr:S-adenosyl-L-methionine-dependent methyltransferase [Fusarium tricinctum]
MAGAVSENQAYFGKIASEYDQRNADAIVQLERYINERIPFIGIKQGAKLLDYACGTGMLSRVLAQHTSEAIGIDLTQDMVDVYNTQAQGQGTSRQAYQGNLADPADASPAAFADAKFFDFDVAGVGLGFHHFDKPDLASKRLAERVKTGGVLFIIDFVAHKIDPEDAAHRGITHHGFVEDEIKQMFENAGLTDFGYQELPEPIAFKDPRGETQHGHDHGHHQGHSHNHANSHNHGHGHGENKRLSMTKRVFIARGTKL